LEPWNQHSKQSKTHSKQHWSEEILINVGTQSGIQQCSKQDVTVLINLQKNVKKLNSEEVLEIFEIIFRYILIKMKVMDLIKWMTK
jgi:DNA polymerase IIIc chi subunit